MLRTKKDAPPAPTLRRLADQLPIRPRRRVVSDDTLRELAGQSFEDPIELHDKEAADRRLRRALLAALRQLSPEDRWLIRERYHRGHSIRAAALALHADPKAIYRRYARMLRSLRRALCAEPATAQRQTA
jgi:DNA-directed RNA polymerase specialized sigma24 family protein